MISAKSGEQLSTRRDQRGALFTYQGRQRCFKESRGFKISMWFLQKSVFQVTVGTGSSVFLR